MKEKIPPYVKYTNDSDHFSDYNSYQNKYRQSIRDSDSIIINIIEELSEDDHSNKTLIDVGCSTGNLLLHLNNRFPNYQLHGADLVESSWEENFSNPKFAGIKFQAIDITNGIPNDGPFDIITANAIFFAFDENFFAQAVSNLARVLKPNGVLIAFDYFTPFNQELTITETTPAHPQGLTMHVRSFEKATKSLKDAGFSSAEYREFQITKDLSLKDNRQTSTYTILNNNSTQMCFRGSLFQPWHHLIARKA